MGAAVKTGLGVGVRAGAGATQAQGAAQLEQRPRVAGGAPPARLRQARIGLRVPRPPGPPRAGAHSPPRTGPQARASSVAAMEDGDRQWHWASSRRPRAASAGSGAGRRAGPAGRGRRALALRGRGLPRVLLSPASLPGDKSNCPVFEEVSEIGFRPILKLFEGGALSLLKSNSVA